jgi:hypothetical protein
MAAVFAESIVWFMFMMVMPGAVMVFGQVMIRTENASTPPTIKGEFMKNFPTIMTTAHYV